MANKPLTYKDAGVDISKADAFVDKIKDHAASTQGPEVLSGVGGFAGLFAPNLSGMTEPVLVGATDGIGTKLSLALKQNHIHNLGQDLVAMCVNDLICCGAKPLFFLDYFATSGLDTEQLEALIASLSKSLKSIDCALLGGETAEMPGLYQKGDFDMAGFAVGAVDKQNIIKGEESVQAGDVLIGLPSSGPHSNGFSLIRKIIEVADVSLDDALTEQLLAPTTLYVNPILNLLQSHKVSALAHITGGGLIENLPRVFNKNLQAKLNKTAIPVPEVFKLLQDKGSVPEDEMWRVFNMGVGFVVITQASQQNDILKHLSDQGLKPFVFGEMVAKDSASAPGVAL